MIDHGKRSLLGVEVDAVDYESAVCRIVEAALAEEKCTTAALAVHGVMTGVFDPVHRYRINHLDLVVPDGQPVRWALNILYNTKLPDRVYGPTLLLKACEAAAAKGLPVFFYGSHPPVVQQLVKNLTDRFEGLQVAGYQPSLFRRLTTNERDQVIRKIQSSGAAIVFVGLGCPRQEVWAFEFGPYLAMPIIAVGAAFDFHAGVLKQSPKTLQSMGLEWAFRLATEPKRLWRRYIFLNPLFLLLLGLQISHLKSFDPKNTIEPKEQSLWG